jgi:hypothetical protein
MSPKGGADGLHGIFERIGGVRPVAVELCGNETVEVRGHGNGVSLYYYCPLAH